MRVTRGVKWQPTAGKFGIAGKGVAVYTRGANQRLRKEVIQKRKKGGGASLDNFHGGRKNKFGEKIPNGGNITDAQPGRPENAAVGKRVVTKAKEGILSFVESGGCWQKSRLDPLRNSIGLTLE